MYKISVIIPVFNSKEYLEKCLNSVLNQSLKDIEIILIDDGSTDNSLQIIKMYASKYKNIKFLTKKNEGQATARNIGIEMANGEFICFVDSDDYIDINMLECLYKNAINNNSDIVICDYVEEYHNKLTQKKSLFINADSLIKSYIVSVAGPCSKIIRSSIFSKNNLKFLENNIYEDLAVIPTLALYTNKISYCEEFFYHYLIRTNSTMRKTKYDKKIESIFNVMNFLYDAFNAKGYNEELEFLFINHLLFAGCGRFLNYKNSNKMVLQIIDIIKTKFPNWKNNKYFKTQGFIYKLTCNIFIRNKKLELYLYKLFRKLKNL